MFDMHAGYPSVLDGGHGESWCAQRFSICCLSNLSHSFVQDFNQAVIVNLWTLGGMIWGGRTKRFSRVRSI